MSDLSLELGIDCVTFVEEWVWKESCITYLKRLMRKSVYTSSFFTVWNGFCLVFSFSSLFPDEMEQGFHFILDSTVLWMLSKLIIPAEPWPYLLDPPCALRFASIWILQLEMRLKRRFILCNARSSLTDILFWQGFSSFICCALSSGFSGVFWHRCGVVPSCGFRMGGGRKLAGKTKAGEGWVCKYFESPQPKKWQCYSRLSGSE